MNFKVSNTGSYLKTTLNNKDLLYSNTIIVNPDNNKILISEQYCDDPLNILIIFKTEIEKNKNDKIEAFFKKEVINDTVLKIEMMNCFKFTDCTLEKMNNKGFFEKVIKKDNVVFIDNYYLMMSTSGTNANSKSLNVNINIYKTSRKIL